MTVAAVKLTTNTVAKLLGLSAERIRQLDAELEPDRTESGVRLFDPAVVEAFRSKREKRQ